MYRVGAIKSASKMSLSPHWQVMLSTISTIIGMINSSSLSLKESMWYTMLHIQVRLKSLNEMCVSQLQYSNFQWNFQLNFSPILCGSSAVLCGSSAVFCVSSAVFCTAVFGGWQVYLPVCQCLTDLVLANSIIEAEFLTLTHEACSQEGGKSMHFWFCGSLMKLPWGLWSCNPNRKWCLSLWTCQPGPCMLEAPSDIYMLCHYICCC